jgi:hypothetical protein
VLATASEAKRQEEAPPDNFLDDAAVLAADVGMEGQKIGEPDSLPDTVPDDVANEAADSFPDTLPDDAAHMAAKDANIVPSTPLTSKKPILESTPSPLPAPSPPAHSRSISLLPHLDVAELKKRQAVKDFKQNADEPATTMTPHPQCSSQCSSSFASFQDVLDSMFD